jgi:hypothetical protein
VLHDAGFGSTELLVDDEGDVRGICARFVVV